MNARRAVQRVLSQGSFELKAILRNGEQLLVTIALPALLMVALARTDVIDMGTTDRIAVAAPGTLALAVTATAFTSQAIATAFDRRNGVLRLLATTPLGKGGLLAGKVLGVLGVLAVQMCVLVPEALLLGWRPHLTAILPAVGLILLGAIAFAALAMLLAGTLRAEAVLAVANLLLIVLLVGGGLILPPDQLPGLFAHLALLLPSGALGEGLRSVFLTGTVPPFSLVVLMAWAAAFGWGASRLFRWS